MTIQDLLKDAYRDGMTLEEITTALADITLPVDGSAEIESLKAALSKSNSEAAGYKKQLREKMSADEIKLKEEAERIEKLQRDYDALLKKSTIADHKARLLALGYAEALATETAEAMFAGDTEKVFAAQQKHLDAMGKKIREEAMQGTPSPTGGSGKPKSAEDIWNISDHAERQAAIAENIDLFEQ